MFARCKKLQKGFLSIILIIAISVLSSWRPHDPEESWKWIQRCLVQSFNQSADAKLKKWDLKVTPGGFFRLRKYFMSGKQEYFSVPLSRLKAIDYSGNSDSGAVIFETLQDDIIVQTYNDPSGNIDSMATSLTLPVLHLEPKMLDSLRLNCISALPK